MTDAGGWPVLRDALQDSDITVRRKVAFLFGSLLIPTSAPSTSREQSTDVRHATSVAALAAAPAAQPVTLQPSEPPAPTATSAALAVVPTPNDPTPQVSQPASQSVHPNSHASMVRDPSSYATSPPTIAALEAHDILLALVSSVIAPVPYGPDGESDGGDADFEEKVLRALHTYVGPCGRRLQENEQRIALGKWLDEQSKGAGGDAKVAERWALTVDEVKELRAAAAA